AHPYSSWERGMNENFNGILRMYIPKGVPIINFSKDFIQNATLSINNKRRKKNGYVSSTELFNNEVKKLGLDVATFS
ncbi:MAG: IS30 family transposase, partial [Bacilli bacterium]